MIKKELPFELLVSQRFLSFLIPILLHITLVQKSLPQRLAMHAIIQSAFHNSSLTAP